jgi:prepilin-type N-terminal cleavage/methylation domain-containing protein
MNRRIYKRSLRLYRSGSINRSANAFTLVEILVVLAIMAILVAISIPALQGLSGAKQFANRLNEISGILEQARAYATAQNTYVWVAFYPYDPSTLPQPDNSGDALCVAVFASNDGTDPINWTATNINVPPSGTVSVSGTSISQLLRLSGFKQIAIRTQSYFTQGSGAGQIASLPSGIAVPPNGPTTIPTFQVSFNGTGSSPLALPSSIPADAPTGQSISVIQFTPSGAARISGSPVDSIWIDFQRAKAKGLIDGNNIAALRINGLTGLATIYRK